MAISLSWLLPGRIIRLDMPPTSNVEDLEANDITINRDYLDASPQEKVHVLIDARRVNNLPRLLPLTRQQWHQHPKLGWVLSVGHSPANRAKGEVVGMSARSNVRHYDTIPEALAFLQSVEPSLPNLLPLLSDDDM